MSEKGISLISEENKVDVPAGYKHFAATRLFSRQITSGLSDLGASRLDTSPAERSCGYRQQVRRTLSKERKRGLWESLQQAGDLLCAASYEAD